MSTEKELEKASERWTRPLLVRAYRPDKAGRKQMEDEAKCLSKHGYSPSAQTTSPDHVNKVRTVTRAAVVGSVAAVTGGVGGFLFRPSRTKGDLVVSYTRSP